MDLSIKSANKRTFMYVFVHFSVHYRLFILTSLGPIFNIFYAVGGPLVQNDLGVHG